MILAADLAHGPHWWIGPLILFAVVYGPPLIYAVIVHRR
jgi:hypothetical protein